MFINKLNKKMKLLEEDKVKFYSTFFKHDLYFVTKKGIQLLKKDIKYDPFEKVVIDFRLVPYCENLYALCARQVGYTLFERCIHCYRNGLNTDLLIKWIK